MSLSDPFLDLNHANPEDNDYNQKTNPEFIFIIDNRNQDKIVNFYVKELNNNQGTGLIDSGASVCIVSIDSIRYTDQYKINTKEKIYIKGITTGCSKTLGTITLNIGKTKDLSVNNTFHVVDKSEITLKNHTNGKFVPVYFSYNAISLS